MRRLIVNADDFGLTPGVSRGILRAHGEGILTSTTFMVHWPWAPAEAARLQAAPRLGVGLHLTLTAGAPVLPAAEVPSLVGPDGRFRRGWWHAQFGARPAEVHREWSAQLRRFVDLVGRLPTHLDTHHYVHALPRLAAVLAEVARTHGIPAARALRGNYDSAVREWRGPLGVVMARAVLPRSNAVLERAGLATPDRGLVGNFDRAVLLAHLERLPAGVTELVCHPGYADEDLAPLSSLTAQREVELAALVDPAVRRAVAAAGIELITFGDLAAPDRDRTGGSEGH